MLSLSPEVHARYTRGWILYPGFLALVAAFVVHWFVTPLITLRMPIAGQVIVTATVVIVAIFPLYILDGLVSEIVRQVVPARCPLCGGRMYYIPQLEFNKEASRKAVEYQCRDCGRRGELKVRYCDVNPRLQRTSRRFR